VSKTIASLAKARQDVTRVEAQLLEIEEQIEASELGRQRAGLKRFQAIAAANVCIFDTQARGEAAIIYAETKIKKPFGGASIAVGKKVVGDKEACEEWCREKSKVLIETIGDDCLTLDWPRFAKQVKKGLADDVPATVEEKVSVRIDKDLSQYL